MTTYPTTTWSETLQQQTREAVEQMPVTPDGCVHFKHPALGYAYATLDDLIQERLLLHGKTSAESYRFEAVESLLQAGWAID